MDKEKIILRYHKRLSREFNSTPRFRIGDTIEVRKNVPNIIHGIPGIGRDWIIWDKSREKIEGMKGEIIDIDYTDDIHSEDKDGCLGYTIKIIGRRNTINVHQEC